MPNGHRGSSGSSPLHSSDSEDRTILKIRKKTLRRRVWRRWRHFARRKALRAAVSGKRKSCGDQHPAESQPLVTRQTQGSPGGIAALPDLDRDILQDVRALGRYPIRWEKANRNAQKIAEFNLAKK